MTRDAPSLRDPGPEVVLSPTGFPDRTLRWGHGWQVGTAAYWIAVTENAISDGTLPATPGRHRIGADLAEEVAACLLGGYGLPHHVGLAAFEAVRVEGLLRRPVTAHAIEEVLRRPLPAGPGTVRYRFPAQRARYLATALTRLRWHAPGIGPGAARMVARPARYRAENCRLDRA